MAGGWASLGLLDELVQAVEEDFKWLLPTAIQDEAIPLILGGGDVVASAETGSGKTAAFAIPGVQLCSELKEKEASADGSKKAKIQASHEWCMSLLDRDKALAVKPDSDGLVIQSRDASRWSGCRATLGVSPKSSKKKVSFECTVLDEGIVRVGWATADATLQLGTDKEGWGYGTTGVKVSKGKYEPYPAERLVFGKGDVIGCNLAFDDEEEAAIISYCKNGEHLGTAFSIKTKDIGAATLFPAVCLKNGQCSFQFSSSQKMYPLMPGYEALASLGEIDTEPNPRDTYASLSGGNGVGPVVIVIEPTRDLADQTFRVFEELCDRVSSVKMNTSLLVGGVNPRTTLDRLKKNEVDILVGTPPILASYTKRGVIQLTRASLFVLDEADELINNDEAEKCIKSIYARLLAANRNQSRFDRLQVCLFSATLESRDAQDLAGTMCNQPSWIKLRNNDSILPDTVRHFFIEIPPSAFQTELEFVTTDGVHRKGKLDEAISFDGLTNDEVCSEKVKQIKMRAVVEMIDLFDMDQVLIFCRTNIDCDLTEKYLRSLSKTGGKGMAEKYGCAVLAGMRSMQERKESLEKFKDGSVRILLATDVAARGLDVKELPYVLNMTLPDTPETYVHRSGRVGRSNRAGLAISFVSSVKERVWFCQKGQKPPTRDTRDYSQGGNCIWYDEPQCFKNITSMLKTNNVEGTRDVYPITSLPADIQRIVDNKGFGDFANESSIDPSMEAKLKVLTNHVKEVEATESALQVRYWGIRQALR
jgi:ATP-dependent RNA helicase DDX1